MDTQAGHRPVRGRAPGAGADGPSQHRQGPRRRRHRVGPALLRHGAGPRHPDHRLLRPRASSRSPSGWSCSSWSAGPCSTRTRRGSSTATSSRRTSWSRSTTACRCPRSSTSASPRRPGQQLTEQDALHRLRAARRHAAVHEPRAGGAVGRGRRHPQRHLQPGRAALRAADRHDAVRPGDVPQGGLRRDAADHPRGGAAEAEHAAEHARRDADDRLGQPQGRRRGSWTGRCAASWTGS